MHPATLYWLSLPFCSMLVKLMTSCCAAERELDFVATLTELLRSVALSLQDNEAVLRQSFGVQGLLRALQAFRVRSSLIEAWHGCEHISGLALTAAVEQVGCLQCFQVP